jgi:DNA-binding NarL/FixJ family response regulator
MKANAFIVVARANLCDTPLSACSIMKAARKRILCVEDDDEMASLIAEQLADRGYEVAVAYDGRDGLTSILKNPPQLVLADVSMPVMSGFQLLERLTALEPRFENMPFIFLTALADRDSALRGWHLGADDYVTKPVDFDVLAAQIAARLARVARNEIWPKNIALGKRQVEALTWVARGKTSEEIARILGVSKPTVEFHVNNARVKLGVATRSEAVAKAIAGRLIEPYP